LTTARNEGILTSDAPGRSRAGGIREVLIQKIADQTSERNTKRYRPLVPLEDAINNGYHRDVREDLGEREYDNYANT
jgi:hypothetical protein